MLAVMLIIYNLCQYVYPSVIAREFFNGIAYVLTFLSTHLTHCPQVLQCKMAAVRCTGNRQVPVVSGNLSASVTLFMQNHECKICAVLSYSNLSLRISAVSLVS